MAETPLSLNDYGESLPAYREFLSGGDNSLQRRAMRDAMYRAIGAELTGRQREILLQSISEQRSVTQIAAQMGLNKSTVSRHLKRAREKLGRILGYGCFPAWRDPEEAPPCS